MPLRVGSVSLYALQRETGLHRDTLRDLCLRRGIPISYRAESTPRYWTRVIDPGDVDRLRAKAAAHPRRREHRGAS